MSAAGRRRWRVAMRAWRASQAWAALRGGLRMCAHGAWIDSIASYAHGLLVLAAAAAVAAGGTTVIAPRRGGERRERKEEREGEEERRREERR